MNLSIRKISLYTLLGCALFAACKKQEYTSIEELDAANIEDYIRANNLTVEPLGTTGMYYQILEEAVGNELSYDKEYAIIYTVKSLDGTYSVADTFAAASRYFDYLGYFLGSSPQGSSVANLPKYRNLFEQDNGLKMALRSVMKKTNGSMRILVPSRLLDPEIYGRNGNADLGIPSNASMDFVMKVIDSASMPAYEDATIRKRIGDLNLNLADYEKTETGIYYHISEQGDGNPITVDSTITCSYNGQLLNGTVFGQSDSSTFLISNNIRAWQEILPKINQGGKIRFFTPSTQAYGTHGSGTAIPAFSVLDFEITVRKKEEVEE